MAIDDVDSSNMCMPPVQAEKIIKNRVFLQNRSGSVRTLGMSMGYKKDIFGCLLYEFKPSHRKLQYKTPEQKEEEYALKDAGL